MSQTIKYKDFIHPEDEAARRNLESIPGFSSVVKAFLKIGYEELYHGMNMANKIRLSEKQLPELYEKLPPICHKFGIAVPEFYLEMNPMPNAYTFGDTRTFLTVNSGLLDLLEEDELEAVLAHECGHIVCRHVLYHMMAHLLVNGINLLGLPGKLMMPVQLGLLYWQRRSELSADRAAAAAIGSEMPLVETMIRLSGGPRHLTRDVNFDEYAAQSEAYDQLQESKWDKLLQSYAVMLQNHPFPAVRVREIRKWAEEKAFHQMIDALNNQEQVRTCPHCGMEIKSEWKFCQHCGQDLTEENSD